MTGIVTSALMGFFAFSGVGTSTAATWANQALLAPTYPSYQVSMTAYNAVPEQTDGDPFTTASGAFSDPDIVAARSVDLADELPFGTVISITQSATSSVKCGLGLVEPLIGLRVVADSMHHRKHNQIDILFDPADTVKVNGKRTNPARAFGVCTDVKIEVVGRIDMKHMPKNQVELKAALGQAPLASSK